MMMREEFRINEISLAQKFPRIANRQIRWQLSDKENIQGM